MTETNINLGCVKINIKRDTHHYAPLDVINPRVLNPIPPDAKTYKLSPSTIFFFKHRCLKFNFGWQKIKKPKEKNMYKKNVNFSEREYAAVRRVTSYKIKGEKRLALLDENRTARKAMPLWQKAAVFLVEAHYDISRFFEDHKEYNYWNKWQYNQGDPKDKLTSFFLKQNKEDKKTQLTSYLRTAGIELPEPRPYVQCKDNRLASKLASFFQQNKKSDNLPIPTVVHPLVQPSAPVLPEPARNPEYQAGTIINNYNFNITCGIL